MRTNAPVLFSLIVVCVCLAAAAIGQDLQPVPPGVTVANRDDAPVTITLNGVEPLSRERAPLNYSVTNVTRRSIRALVVAGVPGTAKYSAIFGGALRPGAAETFSVGNLMSKKARPFREITIDFVLFDDGATWGPNTARDGDHLMGLYEGRKAAYADALRLTTAANERDLIAWLRSAEIARNPPGMKRVLNTQWSEGYLSGYAQAHETFKRDHDRRGLFSIGLRLKAMERDLGLPSTETTAAKP